MEATGNYGYLPLYLPEQSGQHRTNQLFMMTVTKLDEPDACMIATLTFCKMTTHAIIVLKKTVIRQLKK